MSDAIWTLISEMIAPMPLIWMDDNGPRPSKRYAAIRIVRQAGNAGLVVNGIDANGMAAITEQIAERVEVACYGPGALSAAQNIGFRLRWPSWVDRATALGCAVNTVGSVLYLPALLNGSQNEERGIIEFGVYELAQGVDNLGRIEHVVIKSAGVVPQRTIIVNDPTATTPPPVA